MCSKVQVKHTNHWRDGDTGQYFYFSESDLDRMVGDKNWNHVTLEVRQEGSQNWSGKVIVWKDSDTSSAHGRRNDGTSNHGQWAAGDMIQLQRCKPIPNSPKSPQ